jgi:hypothetical protein
MRIKEIPKAVIGLAIVLQDSIEFFLCFSRDGMPVVESRLQISLVKGSKNMRSVREEKSISDIEEDGFQRSGHWTGRSYSASSSRFLPYRRAKPTPMVMNPIGGMSRTTTPRVIAF